MGDFRTGIALNLIGSIFINLGTNIVKLSHLEHQGALSAKIAGVDLFCFGTWRTGFLIFGLGNVFNFISFSFAAQSLLAALGSVQFISNVCFGFTLLGEKVTTRTVVGTGLIVLGNVVIVMHASRSSRSWTAEELLGLYSTRRYQRYLVTVAVLVVCLQWLYTTLIRLGYRNNDFYRTIPFCYGAVSALIGSQSVLLAKSTSELIRSQAMGHSQHSSPFTYAVLLAWMATMAFWLYRMNTALRHFESLFIVPVLQVVWTLFSIVGGGLYFNEFATFSYTQGFMFCLGVLFVIVGVCVLASNRSSHVAADSEDADELFSTELDGPSSPATSPHHTGVGLLYLATPRPRPPRSRRRSLYERVDPDERGRGLSDTSDREWGSTPSLSLALPLFDCDANPLLPPSIELTDTYTEPPSQTRIAHF